MPASQNQSYTPTDIIKADFDRLAGFDSGGWNHNSHYHHYLLENIPPNCGYALDIGCGAGEFSRALAQSADQVLALDLSPKMIALASKRSAELSNIKFQIIDVLSWNMPANTFDCIASIATLHHLPLNTMLTKMKSGLKPGGVLLVLDLYEPETLTDHLLNMIAVPVHKFLKRKHVGSQQEHHRAQQAWQDHGEHDTYLPLSAIRTDCHGILPGAVIRRHLLWRYSIIWHKPLA